MDSLEEEKNHIKNNFLKTYLHIHNPTSQDKPYYKLDLTKNILYLHNKLNISDQESDGIFEFDKIFTNEKDNNLSIYKNISKNILKDSFEGKSLCLISYGNTMSDKFKIFIGDSNNKGIFLQTLDDIKNKNLNNNENIKIYLSFFCLYNDKLVDLSYINENMINNKLEENLMKKSKEINKNFDVNNINKISIFDNNPNDIIDKLFSNLKNIDLDSKYHIYTKSHFCFIFYLINETENNNNIISTLTFILLNGSELLHKNNLSKKSEVSSSLVSVESQYIYNSIICSISYNKAINPDYKNFEKDKLSKLTSILNNICFDHEKDNIKFIVMGHIIPITGYYETTKDTLMFLFNLRQNCFNNKKNNKEKNITRKLSKESRDDVIFDLENKLKFQNDKIENLNKIVEKKDEKIFNLEKNYKAQIEFMKKYFGFKGKIEVLLSGDINTKEYEEAQNIREAKEDALISKRNLIFLEKKLEKKDEEIKRLKLKEDIKLNDQTMLQYYFLADDIRKNKKKDNENKKEFFTQIEKFENDIKKKDKIINELKKELDHKNKILLSIPKVIKNKINLNPPKEVEKSANNEEIVIIKRDKKEVEKDELIGIIKKNKEESDKIIMKYENLLSQSQTKLEEKINQMNKIIKDNKIKFNYFKDELVEFYNVFINLINSYHQNKSKIILFEKTLSNAEKEINEINYPNLFKLISKKNIKKILDYKSKIEESRKDKNDNEQITLEKMKETILNFEGESQSITMPQIIEHMKSKNKSIFSYNDQQIKLLSKEVLNKDYLEIIEYINKLEDYINKYNESQENKKKDNNKNSDIISEYEDKIKKLKESLNTELQKNYNNLMVINSQKKLIEEFNFKNLLNNSKNKVKNIYPLLTSPRDYCSTMSGTQYNKGNNFLLYRNNSKIRNNTEKNIYQQTISNSTQKPNKIFEKSLENFDKNTKDNNIKPKKRPLSSRIQKKGKHVTFINNNNSNKG